MAIEISLLLDIAVILLAAKIFGEVAERLKLSSMLGEIFGGLLVGPLLGIIQPDPFLGQLSSFGILFLLFLIGMSTKFDDVKKDVYMGSALALAGAAISFAFGFTAGMAIFGDFSIAFFLGILLLSTSTAITIRSLIDVGEFKTRIYEVALSVDMADEVVAILSLSLLTTFLTFGVIRLGEITVLFFVTVGFFLFILTVGASLIGKALSIFQKLQDEHVLVAIPLVILFLVSFLSENVGIAGITGAFLAGMAMSKAPMTEQVIIPKMKTLGYGFFIPLFFAYSSVLLDLSALLPSLGLILLLLAGGAIAKFAGIGLLSRRYGMKADEQKLLGASMIPRGEYAIVIAQIALSMAVITQEIYTASLGFVILSMIVTPILLRIFKRKPY